MLFWVYKWDVVTYFERNAQLPQIVDKKADQNSHEASALNIVRSVLGRVQG